MYSKHVSITRSSNFTFHANPAGARLRRNRLFPNRSWILDSGFSRSPTVFRRCQLNLHTSVHSAGSPLLLRRRKRKWTSQHRHVSEVTANISEDTPPPISPKWGQPKFSLSSKIIPPKIQDPKLDIRVKKGSKPSLLTSESSGKPLKGGWGSPKFLATKHDGIPSPPRESGWKRPVFSTSRASRAPRASATRVLVAPVKRGWSFKRFLEPEDEDDVLEFDAYQDTPIEPSEEPLQEYKVDNEVSDELPTTISETRQVSARRVPGTQKVQEIDLWSQDIDTIIQEDTSQHTQTEVTDNHEPAAVDIQSTYIHYKSKSLGVHSIRSLSSRHEARLLKEELLEPLMRWRRSTVDMKSHLKIAIRIIAPRNPKLGRALRDCYASLSYSQTTTYPIAREVLRTYSLRKLSYLEPWLVTSVRMRKIYLAGPFADVLNSRSSLVDYCKDIQLNPEALKIYGLDLKSFEDFRRCLSRGQITASNVYSRRNFLQAEEDMMKARNMYFKHFSFLKNTRQKIQTWFAEERWSSRGLRYSSTFIHIMREYYCLMGRQWSEIYECFLKIEEYRACVLLSEMSKVDYKKLRRRIEIIQRL